jgi:WASH complex subunit strumpellin
LAEYFGGGGSLTGKVAPDSNFQQYFVEIKTQIETLNHSDTTFVGRKVQKLIKALEDVEQFQQIGNNLQIKSYLQESRQNLKHMMTTVNIKKQILVHLAQITDFAYAWQCLKEYKDLMQNKIKNEPSSALLLRATFMKLSSILDAPMVRIIQANSPDTLSVSKYYSGELIKFVKHVLQVIFKKKI